MKYPESKKIPFNTTHKDRVALRSAKKSGKPLTDQQKKEIFGSPKR